MKFQPGKSKNPIGFTEIAFCAHFGILPILQNLDTSGKNVCFLGAKYFRSTLIQIEVSNIA